MTNENAAKNPAPAWKGMTGALPFRMTNDFLFKILLQRNNRVLKAVICAYLDMEPDEIKKIEITNAISLTDNLLSKEMILDVRAEMNDDSVVNLEMQVLNNYDWPERSLSYLCRCYDNLQKGQKYTQVKGAVHIGFLDYTLFPDCPEFYATYHVKNDLNGRLYSSKFQVSVVDLTHIELATEGDKQRHRDLWASFFKAESWEELQMLAEKDKDIEQAVETVYDFATDQHMRDLAWAREDQIRQQMDFEYHYTTEIAKYKVALDEKNAVLAEKDTTIAEKDSTIAEKDITIAEQAAIIEKLTRELEKEKNS